ncbi:MAG: hypothetical protein HOP30_21760 [Cyclobacteriaceae bacterium]|nr:hypothetical protein [Cyclobacteriaceae bacterium]
MSKQKKIDKEFLLTDNSVNSYGFRLLTEGYLIAEYQKNPIGYDMHKREDGVLVRWDDLRVEGDKVYGKPVINLNHPKGQRTVEEIENGFLNAASVGHIKALEWTDDPKLLLPDQTGFTVTKWFNRECSLVDVPGNFNALTKLFDADENPINLSDYNIHPKFNLMKEIKFTAQQLLAMNLSAEANDTQVAQAFSDLVAKAAKADALKAELDTLKGSVLTAEVKGLVEAGLATKKLTPALADKLKADYATNPKGLKDLIDAMPVPAASDVKVDDLIAKGVADKKITLELGKKLAADYKDKAEELKNLIDAMPVYSSLTAQLGGAGAGAAGKEKRIADLAAKSFNELMSTGESEELQKLAPDVWKEKVKESQEE